MKSRSELVSHPAVLGLLFFPASFSAAAYATHQTRPSSRAPRRLMASSCITPRVVTAHRLILLHGYAETSRIVDTILPLLGEKFMVIAPDLPGIGDSDIPANGLDMKTAASAFMRSPARSAFRKPGWLGTTSASWSPMPYARSSLPRWRSWW